MWADVAYAYLLIPRTVFDFILCTSTTNVAEVDWALTTSEGKHQFCLLVRKLDRFAKHSGSRLGCVVVACCAVCSIQSVLVFNAAKHGFGTIAVHYLSISQPIPAIIRVVVPQASAITQIIRIFALAACLRRAAFQAVITASLARFKIIIEEVKVFTVCALAAGVTGGAVADRLAALGAFVVGSCCITALLDERCGIAFLGSKFVAFQGACVELLFA